MSPNGPYGEELKGELNLSGVPGKYDDICEEAAKAAGAKVCLLIIGNGNKGHGFSVRIENTTIDAVLRIPEVLRSVANDIENAVMGKGN